jgi:hypothetical protein
MNEQEKIKVEKKFNTFNEILDEMKKNKTWKVVISILIPIIGIYLLWKNKMFFVGTRIILSVILLFIVYLGTQNSGNSIMGIGNSINGTYYFEKDGYEGKFRISGNSYTGSWTYCINGDCEEGVEVYGVVKDNNLYVEPSYTQFNGDRRTLRGYIDQDGKLHYETGMGEMVLEK